MTPGRPQGGGGDAPFAAESLASEGFIHRALGMTEMVATADRHYGADPRPFVILTIDLDQAGSSWRIDDRDGIYPDVSGQIVRRAITRAVDAPRDSGGTFLPFEP